MITRDRRGVCSTARFNRVIWYPAYLGSRLAAFYERAGHVRTLAGAEGSVTVIGSVSPPGGDFSEPTTRHTQTIVGASWALSKPLADARHYPAIDWSERFSGYASRVSQWWEKQFPEHWSAARASMLRLLHESERESESLEQWTSLPKNTLGLLREADELKHIAAIIGPAALSDRQQWTYYAAGLVKEGFLQQNALDEINTFCSPGKQLLLGALIMGVYQRGMQLIDQGVPCRALLKIPSFPQLKRARTQIPNDQLDKLTQLGDELQREFSEMGRSQDSNVSARQGDKREPGID